MKKLFISILNTDMVPNFLIVDACYFSKNLEGCCACVALKSANVGFLGQILLEIRVPTARGGYFKLVDIISC